MTPTLPGLERLTSVLEEFGIRYSLAPPFSEAPRAGELVLGAPFDPQLAALYAHTDGGKLGDLGLFSLDDNSNWKLVHINTYIRETRQGNPFWTDNVIYFASEVGVSHNFAVVPSLANAEGVQPVLYIDDVEESHLYPLASSVDKALDLWARFCEMRLRKYGVLETWMIEVYGVSIWNEPGMVAEDEELVRLIKAGTFDAFMGQDVNAREWVDAVVQASGG